VHAFMLCLLCKTQNILSYNLFSCSAAAAKRLRLLYSYLSAKGCLTSQQQQHPRYKGPTYEPSKHFEFNTDLKSLYVVVTRARSRLLLYEQEEDVHMVLQDFLQLCPGSNAAGSSSGSGSSSNAGGSSSGSGGSSNAGGSSSGSGGSSSLVAVRQLEPQMLQVFQQASTNEEWFATGEMFFHEGKFQHAEVSSGSVSLCGPASMKVTCLLPVFLCRLTVPAKSHLTAWVL